MHDASVCRCFRLFVFAAGIIAAALLRPSARAQLVTYSCDFETAEGFTTGNLNAQNGWMVQQGAASVINTAAFYGTQSVSMTASSPPAIVSQSFTQFSGQSLVFVDFYAKPTATTNLATTALLDAESARAGILKLGSNGEIYAFDGDGIGGGTWIDTNFAVPVDANGQTVNWVRFTFREDFSIKKWDLYVNGALLRYHVGFRDNTKTVFSNFTLQAGTSTAAALDDFFVGNANPLFADTDNNSIDDAWEIANFGHTGVDPWDDPDHDGLSNWMEFRLGTNPNNADTDGDGIPDGVEFTFGTNPLVSDAVTLLGKISGLTLLLRADFGVTANGSGFISTWADQSGLGKNATQTTGIYQPLLVTGVISGKPVVRFTAASTQFFNLPNLMSGATEGEIFAVIKAAEAAPPAGRGLWAFGASASTPYLGSDLHIHDDFGSTSYNDVGVPPVAVNQFNLYNTSSKASLWQARINSGQIFSSTVNTVGWTTTPKLGVVYNQTSPWSGDMAELIVYNRVLTAAEREAVNTYLATKYGISAPTPAPSGLAGVVVSPSQVSLHWSDANRSPGIIYMLERQLGAGLWTAIGEVTDSMSYFDQGLTSSTTYSYRVRARALGSVYSGYSNTVTVTTSAAGTALPSSGLKLWMRADAGIGYDTKIVYWLDQSGNGNNASQLFSGYQPPRVQNVVNGRPIVRFTAASTQFFSLPNLMSGSTEGEIFAVIKAAETAPPASRGLWAFGASASTPYLGSDLHIHDDFGSTSYNDVGVPPVAVNVFNLYNTSSKTGQWQARMNSGQFFSSTVNTVGWTTTPKLGAVYNQTSPWSGDMAEVVVYNRVLTAAERETVNNYLANKYGIAAVTPAPTGLTATAVSSTQVSLSWTDANRSPGTIYMLERKLGAGSWTSIGEVTDSMSYFDSGLIASTTYSYQVRGRALGGVVSGYSNTATVTTNAAGNDLPTSGQKLWLKADAGISNDAKIIYWLDQSGNGNNATQLISTSQPARFQNVVNGRPIVRFTAASSQFFNLPNLMSGATAGEIFGVIKAAETAPAATRTVWAFGGYSGLTPYLGVDLHIHDDFGSTSYNDLGVPPVAVNQFNLYNTSTTAGLWQARMNNGLFFSSSTNTVGWTTVPKLGAAYNQTSPWSGDMAEVIVYNRVLTAAERETVNNYLANKYGIAAVTPSPTGLTATAVSSTQVNLSWSDANRTPGTIYMLERKLGAGSWAAIGEVTDSLSYFDQGLAASTTYSYQVRGRALGGVISGYSNTATVTTNAAGNDLPTSGQKLWLKADAGISNDAKIMTWMDQSGNGNNASQLTSAYQPARVLNVVHGRPIVRFTAASNQYFSLPNLMSGATEGEIFAVVKAAETAPSSYRTVWGFGTSSSTIYLHTDTHIHDDFGSNATNDLWLPPAPVNQFNLYNTSSKAAQWQVRFNSGQFYSSTVNTVAWSTTPKLGASPAGSYPWSGDLAEVIVYNRVLTATERETVNNYLTNKYGLAPATPAPTGLSAVSVSSTQASLSWSDANRSPGIIYMVERKLGAGSWAAIGEVTDSMSYFDQGLSVFTTYSYQVRARALGGAISGYSNTATVTTDATATALPSTGQKLWLRADAGITSDAKIIYWMDQSGNGNNASQVITSSQPARVLNAINGRPIVRFTAASNQYFSLPNLMSGAAEGEIFAVMKAAETAPPSYRTVWGFGTSSSTIFLHTDTHIHDDFGSNASKDVGLSPLPVNQFNLYNTAATAGLWLARMNGTQFFMTTSNTVAWSTTPKLGISPAASYPWGGDLAEVIVYNRVLSPAEREAVCNYLNRKYVIVSDQVFGDYRDTNGDGLVDNLDRALGFDPYGLDVDGDGIPNWLEIQNGTDPLNADTDGDGVPDGSDYYPLDPTRSTAPTPNPGDVTPPVITLTKPTNAVLQP